MMRLGEAQIKGGLLGCGALTLTMVAAVIAPGPVMQAMFGAGLTEPLAELIVRSWGALVGLIGAALIYAAFRPEARKPLVGLALISKVGFLVLLLLHGRAFVAAATGTIACDTLAVCFLFACLMRAVGSDGEGQHGGGHGGHAKVFHDGDR